MKFSEAQLKTINSLKKLDENIYTLHYQNAYGREKIINSNPKNWFDFYRAIQKYFGAGDSLLNPFSPKGGCVGVTAFNDKNETLFARNFDYKETNCLIVWVDGIEGYKSLCLADFNFMAYGKKHLTIEKSNKARLLAAPYTCMDGINEKGIGISIIEVKFDPTKQESGKNRILPNMILRQVLDTCASIEEVTKVFLSYDVQGVFGNDYHYHVTDNKGNAVVYEYINNKLQIIKNNEKKYYPNKFMYVPSFFISKEGNNKNITVYAKERYDILKEDMLKKNGKYSEEELLKLLEKCKTYHPHRWMPHIVKTVWSIIYNLNTLQATICANNNFNDVYKINLNKPQEINV